MKEIYKKDVSIKTRARETYARVYMSKETYVKEIYTRQIYKRDPQKERMYTKRHVREKPILMSTRSKWRIWKKSVKKIYKQDQQKKCPIAGIVLNLYVCFVGLFLYIYVSFAVYVQNIELGVWIYMSPCQKNGIYTERDLYKRRTRTKRNLPTGCIYTKKGI